MTEEIKIGVWYDYKSYSYQLNTDKHIDGRVSGLYILKKKLFVQNIKLEIVNLKDLNAYNIILFIGYPLKKHLSEFIKKKNKPYFLLLNECEAISGLDHNKTDFKPFDEIFNVTNKKIKNIKFTYVPLCDYNYNKIHNDKKNLICIVYSNKSSTNINENYTERSKFINWFSENKPSQVDLFGNNWNRRPFPNDHKLLKYFNSKYFDFIFKFFVKTPKIWRGKTKNKYITISKYKFNLAFENEINTPGYITEKIFDCFFCNTVPVYYGASDIEKYIPTNCFIDYRDFKNPEKIFSYISSLSDEQYDNYLINAQKFLKSDKFKPFTHDSQANHYLQAIKKYF